MAGSTRPKRPPSTTVSGSKTFTSPAIPIASQRASSAQRLRCPSISGGAAFEQLLDRSAPAVGVEAGSLEERRFADLGLPAADRSTTTSPALGVDRNVADLAGEPEVADDRSTRGDEASTHADFAGHEDHVVGADPGTETRLGEGTQVGVVADADREFTPERRRQQLGQRHVDPPEVRRGDDHAIDLAYQSGHRDAAPDDAMACTRVRRGPKRRIQPVDQRRDVRDRLGNGDACPRPRHADRTDDGAVERDECGADLVDEDLDRQRDDAPVVDAHHRRRATWSTVRGGRCLEHEADRLEFADEAGDRTAGQAGRGDQL